MKSNRLLNHYFLLVTWISLFNWLSALKINDQVWLYRKPFFFSRSYYCFRAESAPLSRQLRYVVSFLPEVPFPKTSNAVAGRNLRIPASRFALAFCCHRATKNDFSCWFISLLPRLIRSSTGWNKALSTSGSLRPRFTIDSRYLCPRSIIPHFDLIKLGLVVCQ